MEQMTCVRHYSYARIRIALALAVSLAGVLPAAENVTVVNEPDVDVLVQLYLPGPVPSVTAARDVASEILAETGINVRWAECASSTKPAKRTGDCVADAEDLVIAMRLETDTPVEYKPGVLAETLPFQDSPIPSRVFLNRVRSRGSYHSDGRILGHVFAHEIGHVLLESDWHSDRGLMARRWNARELAEMLYSVLMFSPGEVRMMHRAISTRAERHPLTKAPPTAEGLN
jgi:hypothetical protein